MLKLTTGEKEELQNVIRFAIDGDYMNNDQEIILERIFDTIKNDDSDNQIQLIWSIEDVQSERPNLSDEQARQVLQMVDKHHDATIGVNWDVLNGWADELFPAPKLCGNCGNFEHYEEENDGYGGCDAKHGTVHEDSDSIECEDFYCGM